MDSDRDVGEAVPPRPDPPRFLPPMRHYAQATAVVIGVAALAALAWAARGVLLMVLIGFLLAAGLDPLVQGLERRMRRGSAVLVVVLAIVIGLAVFVILAIRPAIGQTAEFVAGIPELLDRLAVRFGDSSLAEFLASPEVQDELRAAIENLASLAAESLGAVLGVLAGLLSGVFTAFTVGAITVYLMLALPRIKAFAGRAAGDEERVRVVAESLRRIGGYVTGQLGICACAGIASGLFFLAVGMPYPALLSLVVAVLDAVPQVGATLGAIICTAVALTVGAGTAVAVVIFFIVYQQIENLLVAPRVFASAVSLSPITVFLAVLFGGAVAGFVGAIIALPVAATLKVVFGYAYRRELAAIAGRAVPDALAAAPPSPPRRPLRPRLKSRRTGPGA
ncbi:MAG TPA: AI-2E family transporter [Jiangellaceae bacterium]